MKHSAKLILTYLFLSLLSFSLAKSALAFPSSSTNYRLEGEFGNFGGAKTSSNYRLTDTGGGLAPGASDSISYKNCSGFQCVLAQLPSITFELFSNQVNLGSLSTGSVNTASHTAKVTTNRGPYNLTVSADGKLRHSNGDINDVTDGQINAGSEEYGIATSDTDSGLDIITDTNCGSSPYNASAVTTSPKLIAKSSGPTGPSGETVTICYAASKAADTPSGNYQQILTYIATGTF